MEILFENKNRNPQISFVLLDWSVRESFHMLHYLNQQSVDRQNFEVIWIEYYSRRSKEISEALAKAQDNGMPPPVDIWSVMDIPEEVYYHKHLMYNIGLLLSKGDIVCFCDSDAVARPTFVESILRSFKENPNIVLHLEEVRSIDPGFYPFNYPSVEQVERTSPALVEGKPTGLTSRADPLHTLNYGACMCALRNDLISIGGADEHLDYLGHVCGPYDMTFRLVNTGKREIWHQGEWLYHTWHPGQAGDMNFSGPHDGLHMSTTSREARKSGRVMPLQENPAIRKLRLGEGNPAPEEAITSENLKAWTVSTETGMLKRLRSVWLGGNPMSISKDRKLRNVGIATSAKIRSIIYGDALKYIFDTFMTIYRLRRNAPAPAGQSGKESANGASTASEPSAPQSTPAKPVRVDKSLSEKLLEIWGSVQRKNMYNWFKAGECQDLMDNYSAKGITEISIFGNDSTARFCLAFARDRGIKVHGVYHDYPTANLGGIPVQHVEGLKNYKGHVVIASFEYIADMKATLEGLGIPQKMIHEFK